MWYRYVSTDTAVCYYVPLCYTLLARCIHVPAGTKMGRDHTIYAIKNGRVQILNHTVSVLDLVAEREMLRQQRASNYYMQPTLHTLSKLWTGNAEKVNK